MACHAIVPAAGAGRRFRDAGGAGFKQLHPVDGRAMLACVIDNLLASRVATVRVVTNPTVHGLIVQQRPPGDRLQYAINSAAESEMLDSVRIGIRAVCAAPGESSGGVTCGRNGMLIIPGDHPRASMAAINRCIAEHEMHSDCMIIAACGGRRGHPLILPADLVDEIMEWPPGRRLNELRAAHLDRVRLVETQDAGILLDIDRPSDMPA